MNDLITIPRATVQQALEALKAMQSYAAAERKGLRICDESITALKAAPEQPDQGGKTGWPPGLLQDDCRGLSKWLASQPDARRRVREAVAALEQPVQEPVAVDQRVVPLVESALQAVAEKIGDQCAVWYGIGARDVEEVLREAVRHGLVHGALEQPEQGTAVHMTHCNQGEFVGVCKYGEEDCPALEQPEQPNPWRDAVDHELSTLHMVASDDPRESIRRLIDWHCAAQIDPLVSSAAQELIERGRREALEKSEQEPELRELLIGAAAMAVAAERKGVYQGASWVADAVLEQPEQAEPVAWTATRLWNRKELWTCPADIERDLLEGYTHPAASGEG